MCISPEKNDTSGEKVLNGGNQFHVDFCECCFMFPMQEIVSM